MRLLYIALMFYTRIPTPPVKDFSPEDTNRTTRCFSLVGWIVGVICCIGFMAGNWLFGLPAGVVIALAAGVATTGCFHEDGFADMIDGFGGGNGDRLKILDIMKDSRIGSFGTIALILMFSLKIFTLISIMSDGAVAGTWAVPLIFVTYHAAARMTAGSMVFISRYSRDDGTSKVKPVEKGWTWREALGLYLFGLIPVAAAAVADWRISLILPLLALILLLFRRFCEKRIGGYTGDCLGALEQLSEIAILLFIVIILKF